MEQTTQMEKKQIIDKIEDKPYITIHCTCGHTYTITEEGTYIYCKQCLKPPLFAWNGDKRCHSWHGIAQRTVKTCQTNEQ